MIKIRKVSVNNLKEIDLDLPTGVFIVFCGRSGSGKSSLVFDTLYAEGQRKYIETFSADVRRFLEPVEKPKAEVLDGIPISIAVTGNKNVSNGTAATVSGVYDDLRFFFAKLGKYYCPDCSVEVKQWSPQSIADELQNLEKPCNIQFAFPVLSLDGWKEAGFIRGIYDGKPFRLDETSITARHRMGREVLIIADRLTLGSTEEIRIIEALETAMHFGEGECNVLISKADNKQEWDTLSFSERFCCNQCGKRFSTPEEPAVKIADKTIDDVCGLRIDEAESFINSLPITNESRRAFTNIKQRIEFLTDTGLNYLTLSRPVSTLSTGELRRLRLAAVLASSLTDVLYVLDEPTCGLHPKEIKRLLSAVFKLRDKGNTVAVVEHNEQFLRNADMLVEIGPGAGKDGGQIVFQGTPQEMYASDVSLTGKYLRKVNKTNNSRKPKGFGSSSITLTNCTGRNLNGRTFSFPLESLCVVTGVSGAGKHSLVIETLYPALCQTLRKECYVEPLPFGELHGTKYIDDVIMASSRPCLSKGGELSIGRTPRSNPATYLKILDEIRNVFAAAPEAKTRCFTAGHFSFNTENGRCPYCKGDGYTTTDMQFLPDLNIPCPECKGKRYREEVLEILYRGSSIADVLSMTAREAFAFFRGKAKVQHKIKYLLDAGLDYIQLGQPANTLSGGESQRMKIAVHLAQIKKAKTLFILDEPSSGLHFADIEQLLDCFDSLIRTGHSFIVIEHNPQIIEAADNVIEL